MIREQFQCIRETIAPVSAKVGMLYRGETIEAVANELQSFKPLPRLVVDPLIRSSSGEALLQKDALFSLKDKLIPMATVFTPNLYEAMVLLEKEITGPEEAAEASQELARKFGAPVLIKGGHIKGSWAIDFFSDGNKVEELEAPRIENADPHGTGCALSSAIAAGLALGLGLREAIFLAKLFVTQAIAKSFPAIHGQFLDLFPLI
ncbi:hypothetical protein MPNT_50097 [Candidatus Methylacidithermus pantelleriae]|uniref:hydroxymethylpyrimidine kinase n=2 Tax=Candidatus Methylacidithermus pantelleriae TaxID=2744239 RepID=A0A8J2FPG4_9BACT|nr:hypothetical protein MPNT_50097 [Candidatus Methylacidithermus pantelleriae]